MAKTQEYEQRLAQQGGLKAVWGIEGEGQPKIGVHVRRESNPWRIRNDRRSAACLRRDVLQYGFLC